MQDFGFHPPSPQKAPQKVPIKINQKNQLQVPTPKKEHVDKASSPIALRYWNQCLNTGDTKTTNNEDAPPPEKNYGDYLDLPWLLKDESSPSPSPNPSPQPNQHHMKPNISVPDIRRHMQEVQSNTNWEEILQEEDRRKTSVQQPAFYRYKEITKFKSVERHSHSGSRNITSSNQQEVISTNMVKTDILKAEGPRHVNKPKPEPFKFLQPPVRSRAHDDPSPVMDSPGSSPRFMRTPSKHPENPNSLTERVPVEYERILSTAGQGIKRENEKKEAKMNINRFITMGKIKSLDESSPPVQPNSYPSFNSTQSSSNSPKTCQKEVQQNIMYTPNTPRKLALSNPTIHHKSLISEKEFLEKHSFSTIDSDKAKVSKLNKQESCSSNFSSSDSDSELYPHKTNSTVRTNNVNKAGQDDQTTKAVTDHDSVNLEKVVLNYFQKTDPKDIGEIIVKKLDEKRKNALGNNIFRIFRFFISFKSFYIKNEILLRRNVLGMY